MTTEHSVLILQALWPGIPRSSSRQPGARGGLRAPFCQRLCSGAREEGAALLLWSSMVTTGVIHDLRCHQNGSTDTRSCPANPILAMLLPVQRPPPRPEPAGPRHPLGPGLGLDLRRRVFTLGRGPAPLGWLELCEGPLTGEGLPGCGGHRAAPEIALHTARAGPGAGSRLRPGPAGPSPGARAATGSRLLLPRGWGCLCATPPPQPRPPTAEQPRCGPGSQPGRRSERHGRRDRQKLVMLQFEVC